MSRSARARGSAQRLLQTVLMAALTMPFLPARPEIADLQTIARGEDYLINTADAISVSGSVFPIRADGTISSKPRSHDNDSQP